MKDKSTENIFKILVYITLISQSAHSPTADMTADNG